jgi:hypothetical protein
MTRPASGAHEIALNGKAFVPGRFRGRSAWLRAGWKGGAEARQANEPANPFQHTITIALIDCE